MKVNCIMVVKNNVDPKEQIVVNVSDMLAEPSINVNTSVDYDSLSAAEKTQFNDCVTMVMSKIPA